MKAQRAAFTITIGFTLFVCLIWNIIEESCGFQTSSSNFNNNKKALFLQNYQQRSSTSSLTRRTRTTTRIWEKEKGKQEEFEALDPKFIERNKRWIVIVDDEEDIRLAVGDYLYDQGYQVTACADADSMLEVCSSSSNINKSMRLEDDGTDDDDDEGGGQLPTSIPDAIVSDIRMPGKDGLQLLGLIRADQRLARVPVILLTAKGMTKDRIDGYKAGADVYLPKPFDPDELLSIIDNTIQRRKQMSGRDGNLMDLKQDMESIKQIMKKNSATVVERTNVFLTDSERDVLELICKGYTNAEIATQRGATVLGINKITQNLYSKTETGTRTELTRWAIKTGYVPARPR